MKWSLNILRICIELFLVHDASFSDFAHDRTLVSDCLNHIPCTGFALCSDKRSALRNTTEGLSQVPGPTDKRDFEGVLVYVMLFVRRGQDLRLIDIIDTNLLENL